jgi:hypothetical protein
MKFYSQTLQNSFDEAKPILEQVGTIETKINQDILTLESVLKTVNLKESITYAIKSLRTAAHHEELLVWNHYHQKIFYIKNSFNALFVTGDKGYSRQINYRDKETLIEESLIETPISLKKTLWENGTLALFLSFLTQKARARIPADMSI